MPPVRKGWVRVTPEHKKLSRSEAKYRRRVLSEARKKDWKKEVFNVDQRITDKIQAKQRLMKIDQILSPEDQTLSTMEDVTDQEREQIRTGLEIEHIWLQSKLGTITSAEKERSFAGIFNGLKKAKPDVYNWLVATNEDGLSMLEQIRNKVFPPIHVGGYYGGYYTKR